MGGADDGVRHDAAVPSRGGSGARGGSWGGGALLPAEYDNDGRERRAGWGRVVTTGEMAGWDGMMHAVVTVGSRVAGGATVPRVIPRMGGAGGTLGTGIDVG